MLRDDGASVMLIDVGQRITHTVNSTGGMIWAQCDGHLSVDEVIATLADMYSTDPSEITGDVTQTISEFRQRGLLRAEGDPPFPSLQTLGLEPGPDSTSYVVPTPCGCGTDLGALEWPGQFAVQVGPVRMGIRYDSDATGGRVRELLAHRIVDDGGAPVTYTVVLLSDGQEPPVPTLRSGLYEGRRFQLSPNDHDGILTMLSRRVEAWAPLNPTEVRLSATGVDGPSGTVLAPAGQGLDEKLADLGASAGYELLAPPIVIDTAHRTTQGRPVVGMVWPGPETERVDPDDALIRLVGLADLRPGDDVELFVDGLDRLATTVTTLRTGVDQVPDVARALIRSR